MKIATQMGVQFVVGNHKLFFLRIVNETTHVLHMTHGMKTRVAVALALLRHMSADLAAEARMSQDVARALSGARST